MNFLEMQANGGVFRTNQLKKFMQKILAEINPSLQIAVNAYDFYAEVFQYFLLPRVCYAYWSINNNCSDEYRNYPEGLKMDFFLETAWNTNYVDDINAKFVYDLN